MNTTRVTPRGFTLIELLTVIAIVGVLAGIIIPVVGKVRETARNTVSSTNVRALAQANLLYAGENRGISVLPTNNVREHCAAWARNGNGFARGWAANERFMLMASQTDGFISTDSVTRSGHRARLKNNGEQSIGMNQRARGNFWEDSDAARVAQSIRLNQLTNANTLVLFGEADGQWIEPGTNSWNESRDTSGGYSNQVAFRNGRDKAYVSTYAGNVLLLDRSVLSDATERARHFNARF